MILVLSPVHLINSGFLKDNQSFVLSDIAFISTTWSQRTNEGVNTLSTGPPYQRFPQGSSNVSFSLTLLPTQQIRVNEGTSGNIGHNVGPPAAPHFSQTLPPSRSQQVQVNEGAVDDIGVNDGDIDNARSTSPQFQQQLSSQRTSSSQTLPSSQQLGVNDGAVDDFNVNTHSTDPPHQQRFLKEVPILWS